MVRTVAAGKAAAEESLADLVSVGLLASIFPMSMIDEVVETSGCAERRRRALPARLVIYYVLALCLFGGKSYDQVMRLLLNGLAWRSRWTRQWEAPTASAISRARARLGAEPMRMLFCRVAGPVAGPQTRGAWYVGLRLVTLDGATLDVPDTGENAVFGHSPGTARLSMARLSMTQFPRVRVLAVAECGTHALVDATFGAAGLGDDALARRLLRCLKPGMLLLAGFEHWRYDLWRDAAGTGAQLLWEIRSPHGLPAGPGLDDGSYLSSPGGIPIPIRVIEFAAAGADPQPRVIRLVTTLIDPGQAPAAELAARYARRWAMGAALAWLTSDRRSSTIMLRSKNPEMVAQEIWALLCTYQAMRALTCQGGGGDRLPCLCARPADVPAPGPAKFAEEYD